jgi:hypothetical protein
MNRTRLLLLALGYLLVAVSANAQPYELKSGNFNSIFVAQTAAGAPATPSGPPNVINPPATANQFSAMGQVAGAVGPVGTGATVYKDRYPSDSTKTLILARVTIGGVFASGVPRYALGDEITPPLVQADGVTPAASGSGYWRVQPVQPGEAFVGVNSGTPLFPLGSVNVTAAATSSTLVTVDTVVTPLPAQLVVGATLLGQPITRILGNTVTLAGNANASISGITPVAITPTTTFYYSPHAEKVYASQAGRVTITWVTRVPDGNGNYFSKNEDFAVSSNTALPIRTIYWTEGSFDGPKVQITDGRITTVNPAYYNLVPKAVAQEVTIPGYNPLSPNLTTLSFDKYNGAGQLHAYNVEGRILIEYLGNIRLGNSIYESLGTDIVELVRVPAVNYRTVHLGKEITPHEPSVSIAPPPGSGTTAKATATVTNGKVTGLSIIDGGSGYGVTPPVVSFATPDSGTVASATATVTNGVVTALAVTGGGSGYPVLTASPVLASSLNPASYYNGNQRSDSTTAYIAERETSAANNPDNGTPASQDAYNKVVFYWMKEGAFSIKWPQYQDRYWLRWSPNLNDYAHYSVDTTAGSPATGVPFTDGSLPTIVYQDDPAQSEAQIDLTTQRLYVNFDPNSDQKNRALLKFIASASTWYVNLYTQAEDRQVVVNSASNPTIITVSSTADLTVGMSVTGGGIPGSATILSIIDGTRYVLSKNIVNATNMLRYGGTKDLSSISNTPVAAGTTVTVSSTADLEVGMIVTGTGITGAATIVSITDLTHLVISQSIATNWGTLSYTVQSDAAAPITTTALVGTRLIQPAGHENAGYISSGSNYYPSGYLNPFMVGVTAANLGAIIPVNARPTDNQLTVRWFKKIPAPSSDFKDLYVPGKIGRYTVSYPASTTPQIVIAQGVGTGDLSAAEAAGSVYYQNDSTKPGYNPNEEHALAFDPRVYALREDLNVTNGTGYTSEPFVLVAYTDPSDKRPSIHAYKVLRTDATYNFDYTATAGTLLVAPYPLPLMPLPQVVSGESFTSKNLEIIGEDNPANTTLASDDAYKAFTFKDRKGFTWVHRGPHDAGSPTFKMKLYYLSRAGFFIPGIGEPAVGTVLPFLRAEPRKGLALDINKIDSNANGTPGQIDEPLTVIYRPAWPTGAPELRVGETLTLPKFGLPQVRGQKSAQVFYQQSLAKAPPTSLLTKNSVTLHDPTREKTVAIDVDGVGMDALPTAIRTTSYQGKTYFQGLPPHLQKRLYLDPLRGKKGTLVFTGTFHDEIAGEDYVDLNLLTATEETLVKSLVPEGATDKSKWDAAIDALNTTVETFKNDPAKFGSYIVDTTKNADVGENELAVVDSPNTAVDSYAITATGQGTGYVTMVFGNGLPKSTPEGDPVQVKVFKVANQLYTGDLKVIQSSNPLDEQVTMRHSGDFAGKPEDYDFEWRWTTGAASAPAIYTTVPKKIIGDPTGTPSNKWVVVRDPGAVLPSEAQYPAPVAALPFPRAENVHPVNYVLTAQNQPTTTVIEATSYTDAEIAAGYPSIVAKSTVGVDFSNVTVVPGNIVFSAKLGTADGCVLYVNGRVALAFNAPTPQFTLINASTGLSKGGLEKQFSIAPSYFTKGPNTIEVAIYTQADPNAQSSLDFMLEADEETDVVATGSVWQTPAPGNTNTAIIGGSPTLPFGGPQFVLNDRWFTMRYKPKASANNVLGTPYSRWMEPMLVEGWIKRVLAAINPFQQRVKDLYNNQINSDVSVITQAGKRWEGDIALTMDNINDVGLIEIYETVLNRGKSMSIDANTNDPDTNNALILAAGYLNDLYTILGNEAYADAANPTISLDDQTSVTEVNTSRFSFEGQVASSLDEELALLRGRDDFVSPGVKIAPAYNRLYWNYTRGINSGEVIYAVNYNVKEKVGSSTANGVIDGSDAQRMFPQGHGDAYGHYLTALTGYYRLLTNANFTWTPRAEAVTVLGQPVTVDYMDERKFAAAAGNVARTAQQVAALSFRQSYKDDPAAGWSSFRDSKGNNTQTGVTSRQGLDEWVSRGTQGAFFHWAVANALVPDVDNSHSGVQKIDRSTVPEIAQLATAASSLQTTIDNANAHINPLGLSPGSIAFDLSPTALTAGQSQFEQVYERSLRSLVNASGAFNQASRMSRSLRNQQNQIDDYNSVIVQQERAYVNQLIGVFGRPYSGDVGPGKTYAQGYVGPDTERWFVVDRPSDLVVSTAPVTVTMRLPTQVRGFTGQSIDDVTTSYQTLDTTEGTLTITPNRFAQFAEVIGTAGNRPQTGALQESLLDAYLSQISLLKAANELAVKQANFSRQAAVFKEIVKTHQSQFEKTKITGIAVKSLETAAMIMTRAQAFLEITSDTAFEISEAAAESLPKSAGLSSDVTAPVRGSIKLTTSTVRNGMAYGKYALMVGAAASQASADVLTGLLKSTLKEMDLSLEERQLAYELEANYRDLLSQHFQFVELTAAQLRADQKAVNLRAEGDRILSEREVFRQRAAAIIQGYRTKDLGFRIFRNEALEQYRSLFDLASRYSYLAAKSYDYETGLLGTTDGKRVFDKIVASRSLGDLTGGAPQSTTSTLGDAGLAGTMAQLNADFSVAEGRLGINNPDQYGTVFSLRSELYRIRTDQSIVADDDAWQQTLEQHIVSNLMTDADVATYCRNLKKPNGTPVPGIIIPFSTSIQQGQNFFGLPLAAGDHAYTASSFATKIYNVGIALPGYVGMDSYAMGNTNGAPASGATNALSATPYAYLIPCGNDFMLAPPLGDTNTLRSWSVKDQALPLPYNLGANDFNSTQFFNANGTLSEQPWILRKHQAFRMVSDATSFYSRVPAEFTNSRLIGRSVWNSQWKIVIPAYTLLNNEYDGLNKFVVSVKDIQLFLRTYSNSGN